MIYDGEFVRHSAVVCIESLQFESSFAWIHQVIAENHVEVTWKPPAYTLPNITFFFLKLFTQIVVWRVSKISSQIKKPKLI